MLLMMVALLVIGAFTGFMAGLLGVGGGMMLTPFMTFLFTMAGFPDALVIKMALATSLTTILFTSVTSVRAHHQSGKVRWDIAKPMGLGAFWGTFLGANFASALKSEWLAIFFAVFVGYSAIKMFRTSKPKPSREVPGTASLAAVGSGVGFISSLLGAGGGFLSTPFMVWCNVSMHQAIGTRGTVAHLVGGLYLPAGAGGMCPCVTHHGPDRRENITSNECCSLKAGICRIAAHACPLHGKPRVMILSATPIFK